MTSHRPRWRVRRLRRRTRLISAVPIDGKVIGGLDRIERYDALLSVMVVIARMSGRAGDLDPEHAAKCGDGPILPGELARQRLDLAPAGKG